MYGKALFPSRAAGCLNHSLQLRAKCRPCDGICEVVFVFQPVFDSDTSKKRPVCASSKARSMADLSGSMVIAQRIGRCVSEMDDRASMKHCDVMFALEDQFQDEMGDALSLGYFEASFPDPQFLASCCKRKALEPTSWWALERSRASTLKRSHANDFKPTRKEPSRFLKNFQS